MKIADVIAEKSYDVIKVYFHTFLLIAFLFFHLNGNATRQMLIKVKLLMLCPKNWIFTAFPLIFCAFLFIRAFGNWH